RISQYIQYLITIDKSLESIDYNRVRVDTLHGLCNDIMQEFRFTGYQNYRLLDDIEQRLFILEHSSPASLNKSVSKDYDDLWPGFSNVFDGFDPLSNSKWSPGSGNPPNRNIKTKGLSVLFNRIVEDMLDTTSMRKQGEKWELLVKAYEEYRDKLFQSFRCDFAHVQSKFLEFLNSEEARLFLDGNESDEYPGVKYVLVDEYQDTNPIQEEIYFKLTENSKNLCVVGDDDQALYRFRGGTVDCMVNFENSCQKRWEISKIGRVFLSTNYRSNPGIISFYDGYIRSFQEMGLPGARVRDKPKLTAGSTINGTYPSVAIHKGQNAEEVSEFFANMVIYLHDNHHINDYSECVLLLPSTRRSKYNAGPFMDALEKHSIPYYNPRSRGLLEEKEIKVILGGLLEIIDPNSVAQGAVRFEKIRDRCVEWRMEFDRIADENSDLRDYVTKYAESIMRMGPKTSVGVNLLEIFYDLLNFPPISNSIDDPEISLRIGVVCKVLDAFSNVPSAANIKNMLGFLYTSSNVNQGISFTWRKNFYYSLLGLLASEGLNEAEDEIENFPRGRVPIMTIHQSKGLEFPVVFVYGLSSARGDSEVVKIETDFARFRRNLIDSPTSFTPEQKAKQDIVRLFFVAYSRAQYALILLAKRTEYTKPGVGFGGSSSWTAFGHSTEI
ncbi:MAG: ATP-dependent helicase, partial [Thermoplasmatales archaeon]